MKDTNKLTEAYHRELCELYCATSHSDVLALGHSTTRTLDYALFNLTPDLLMECTELQTHKRGLRLRFNLTGSQYYRLCKRYAFRPQMILASHGAVEERRAQLIEEYPSVKPATFNTGRVFESLLADRLGIAWSYSPIEERYDRASDLEDDDMRVQCKLTSASISESSILNALKDANR